VYDAGRDALSTAKQKQHADVVKLLEMTRCQQQQLHRQQQQQQQQRHVDGQ